MITPIAPIAIYADYAGTFEVRDRNEARIRLTPGTDINGNTTIAFGTDYVNTPLARVSLFDRHWRYFVAYAPSFTASDLQSNDLRATQLFHNAGLGVSWRERFVTLSLTEDGSYGEVNFAFLAPNPDVVATPPSTTPTPQPAQPGAQPSQPAQPTTPTTPPSTQAQTPVAQQTIPSTALIKTGSSTTNLTAFARLARGANAFASVGFIYAGGIDEESRQQVPQRWGPRGDIGFDYRVARLDTLVTRFSGTNTDFSFGPCPGETTTPTTRRYDCKPHDLVLQGTETLLHRLTPSTVLSVTAGGGVVRTRNIPTEANRTIPIVTALASYQYTTEIDTQRTILRFDAGVSPVTDIRLGTVDNRGSVGVTMTLPMQRYTLVGAVVAARTLVMLTDTQEIQRLVDIARQNAPVGTAPPPAPVVGGVSLFRADLELTYRVNPILTVGGGVRSAWQYQDGLGAFNAHVVFGQVTLIAPTMRF